MPPFSSYFFFLPATGNSRGDVASLLYFSDNAWAIYFPTVRCEELTKARTTPPYVICSWFVRRGMLVNDCRSCCSSKFAWCACACSSQCPPPRARVCVSSCLRSTCRSFASVRFKERLVSISSSNRDARSHPSYKVQSRSNAVTTVSSRTRNLGLVQDLSVLTKTSNECWNVFAIVVVFVCRCMTIAVQFPDFTFGLFDFNIFNRFIKIGRVASLSVCLFKSYQLSWEQRPAFVSKAVVG